MTRTSQRGANMSVRAAASGLVVLLLTLPVVQSNTGWGVTYSSTQICALKGSTVNIHCTYKYPNTAYPVITVMETFWFVKESNNVFVDLRTDPDYKGRVAYSCENTKTCTLTITDLRASDSAEYKFRFITDQERGHYSGVPGVTLSVAELLVQVTAYSLSNAVLRCESSCPLPDHLTYIWYKNGQNIREGSSNTYSGYLRETERYSCAVKGHETFPSPRVAGVWGVTYASTRICAFTGSAVKIHCTFRYPTKLNGLVVKVKEMFWFVKMKSNEPVALKEDSDYVDRVDYQCEGNSCSLTIRDLRQTDSANTYKFRFITNRETGRYTGEPGVSLSVSDRQLRVDVRKLLTYDSSWTELTCRSSCQPLAVSYVWYKDGREVPKVEKSYFHLDSPDPSDSYYYCAIKGYEPFHSPSVYAPKSHSVSVSPEREILEGSSVTLTCSSDANPAANYTWFKENQTLLRVESQLIFSFIQSSDSGQYHCAAENELGRRTSQFIFINVKYAPQPPSVSVSPSGEIVEGSSVTLTCSSDANPAAKYTWYKENQTLLEEEPQIVLRSIQSSDSGHYHCAAENKIGSKTSGYIFINVKYAPQLPSVSVSPSSEIVEGSSVTLTCSTDANPAANYTWFKEKEESPKASGQIFTITDIRPEHSGNYYCEAWNSRGRHNTTFTLTVVADFRKALKSAAFGICPFVLFIVVVILIFLLMRKKRTSKRSTGPKERLENREQSRPIQSEEQHDVQYASVFFMTSKTSPIYSNITSAGAQRPRGEEDEHVEYATVQFKSTDPRTKGPVTMEDPSALYSTVSKI